MSNMIKRLSSSAFKKIIPLIILSLIALAIWYGGPLLAIADFIPLATPEKRLCTILTVFLAWGLIVNLLNVKTPLQQALTYTFNNPELTKKLLALDKRFQSATRFLKKTFVMHHGKDMRLDHLPWYLLIGTAHSGKTSLLANANIPFVLARKFKHNHFQAVQASEACDWFVTRDLVLVDVPGTYINSRLKNPANTDNHPHPKVSPHNILWKSFLSLLKKYRGKKAIEGVVIALPLPELIAQQHHGKERILLELKQRSEELRQEFGTNLPFHLVITKCDLLPGFSEFFSDSGVDELSQAWGITMPASYNKDNFIDLFITRFNALIKRLNKQLIWRLHQERNPAIRPQIKDFPLHIERLKESILSALRTLEIPETNLKLQGIYLTSATQIPAEARSTSNLFEVSTALQTAQLVRHVAAPLSKGYFIRQLLLRGLAITASQPTVTPPRITFKWKDRPYLYSTAASMILFTVAFVGNQFRHHIQETNAIKAGFAQYQHAIKQPNWQNSYIADALPLFNALQQAIHDAAISPLSHKDHEKAVAAYHQALQKIVFPEIKHDLESYLTKTNNKNPQGLYIALKAYLMLDDAAHYQPDFIFSALKIASPALFNNPNNDAVVQQIYMALTSAWQPMTLSPELINYARKQMLNLVPAEIGYAILKSYPGNSLDNTVSLGANTENQSILVSKEISDQIPKIFTAADFTDIYTRQIPMAVTEIATKNWVLGTGDLSIDTAALTLQLRNLYVANYIDVWESTLANIGFAAPQNLAEVDAKIVNLTSNNSSLLQLLQTIKQNTGFAPITTISPKLAEINALLNSSVNQPNSELNKVFIALNQLHADLQIILRATDRPAAAFQAAQTHVQNAQANQDSISQLFVIAENSPAPVKNWLENITTESWHYVLQDAASFIESHWQSDVMTVYNAELANRFPFTPNATQEVSLEQFSKFLGTRGTLATFFRTYLQPFADNSNKTWEWRKVHNEHLPFSDIALNQIQHAAHVQRAFFPGSDNQPMIKFMLQPIALETNTKSLQLNVEGQVIQYDRSMPSAPQALTWPGTNNIHATILNLLADNDAALNDNSNSEWGWFRLVGKSTLKIVSPKELMLSFELNGHKATVLLFSQGRINPFLPSNLQNFRLPMQLKS
jgi:type VI secretion system protein ImpL